MNISKRKLRALPYKERFNFLMKESNPLEEFKIFLKDHADKNNYEFTLKFCNKHFLNIFQRASALDFISNKLFNVDAVLEALYQSKEDKILRLSIFQCFKNNIDFDKTYIPKMIELILEVNPNAISGLDLLDLYIDYNTTASLILKYKFNNNIVKYLKRILPRITNEEIKEEAKSLIVIYDIIK